jgi:hypothetical protein
MFCEEPFTNDRPQHILACSIIQPDAVGTESEPIILSLHSKQDFSVLIRDGLSASPTFGHVVVWLSALDPPDNQHWFQQWPSWQMTGIPFMLLQWLW